MAPRSANRYRLGLVTPPSFAKSLLPALLVLAPAIGCGDKTAPAVAADSGAGTASAQANAAPSVLSDTAASAQPGAQTSAAVGKGASKGEPFDCFEGKVMEGIRLADAYLQELAVVEAGGAETKLPDAIKGLCSRQTGLEACIEEERVAKRKIERAELLLTAKNGAITTVTGWRPELVACLQKAFAGAPSGGATSLRYTYTPGLMDRSSGPKLRIKDAKGTKDLPDEVLARILRTRYASMRACQTKALAANPKLAGSAAFTLSIDAGGKTTKVAPSNDKLGDPKLTECLQATTADLMFPKPTGGKTSVSYRIELGGE